MEMKSNLPMSCSFSVALLFVLSVCSYAAASTCPLLLASGAEDSDKTGNYIVVLKDETTHERFEDIKSKVVSMTEDEEVHGSVETVVKAFTVKLSDRALSTVSTLNNTIRYYNCCSSQHLIIMRHCLLHMCTRRSNAQRSLLVQVKGKTFLVYKYLGIGMAQA